MGQVSRMVDMEWSPGLIVISYLVSVQAAYTAILILQMRFSKILLALAALCLSISGIWSMHFIGMAAMTVGTHIHYDIGWTVASAVFAFLPALAAFFIIDYTIGGRARSTDDVSMAANLEAFKSAPHLSLVLSANFIAIGVCAMHYTGMHAMAIEGAAPVLDWGVIIASCIIAVAAATAALYFAFVLPLTRRYTIPTAMVAGVAVCGMHYTGMYGFRFEVASGDGGLLLTASGHSSSSIDSAILFIVFGSSAISSTSLAFAAFLYRRELRAAAQEAEDVAAKVAAGRFDELQRGDEGDTEEGRGFDEDPITRKFRLAYITLGDQLRVLKSFMPASLLAQFEAQQQQQQNFSGNDDGDEGTDDEGSLSISASRSPSHSASAAPGNSFEFSHRSIGVEKDSSTVAVEGSAIRRDTVASLRSAHSRTSKDGNSKSFRASKDQSVSRSLSNVARRNVAILAANVVDFHQTFECTPSWYTTFVTAIDRVSSHHRGVLEQISGDHIMMSFNASRRCGSPAASSLATAFELQRALPGSCLSMGATSGVAVLGNMGSEAIRRFTILTPAIKAAWTLEQRAHTLHRDHGVHLLCARSADIMTTHELRAMDVIPIAAGRQIVAYEPLPMRENAEVDMEWMYRCDASEQKLAWWAKANAMVEALARGEPGEAASTVAELQQLREAIATAETTTAGEGIPALDKRSPGSRLSVSQTGSCRFSVDEVQRRQNVVALIDALCSQQPQYVVTVLPNQLELSSVM